MPPRAPKALRILMIASEAFPFSKTGGLADVSTALSKALGRLGHDVTLITPRYRGMESGAIVEQAQVHVAGIWWPVTFGEAALGPGARVLFLDCPPLYDRAGIYNENGVDYDDNAVRFGLLAAASIDWLSRQPDPYHIVHAHDHKTDFLTFAHAMRGSVVAPDVFRVERKHEPQLFLVWCDGDCSYRQTDLRQAATV